jgi:hypothetical protein
LTCSPISYTIKSIPKTDITLLIGKLCNRNQIAF